jgi:glycosyltransferase involved in cell wall biosynthesis
MDRKLVLFGSADSNDPRKGAGILLKALEKLDADRSEVDVVMFGPERVEISGAGGFRVHQVGKVDEVGLRLLYSAADTFVTPAVEDNLPNTVLESLAAGTPVVGFDIGGIGEMVDHKTNGYLAESRDAADLAAGIQTVLERTDEGDSMAVQARSTAVAQHEIEDVATKYRELYRDIAE